MFESTSRYYKIETDSVEISDANGESREIRYVRRRFIPQADTMTTIVEHPTTQGERLDNITARYLGDPTQFWRVCDANNAMRPDELTEEPGSTIKIALPQP